MEQRPNRNRPEGERPARRPQGARPVHRKRKKKKSILPLLLILLLVAACVVAAGYFLKNRGKTPATSEESATTGEESYVPREKEPVHTEFKYNDDVTLTSEMVREHLDQIHKDPTSVEFIYDQPVQIDTWQTVLHDQSFYDQFAIGAIHIPNQSIRLPIIQGMSDKHMHAGAATLTPYQVMGTYNYPLISHKMFLLMDQNILFNWLEFTKMGSVIRLTDLETIWEYEAYAFDKIGENETDVLDPFENFPEDKTPEVSLITCVSLDDPDSRYVLRGKLVKQYPYTQEAFDANDPVYPDDRGDNQ